MRNPKRTKSSSGGFPLPHQHLAGTEVSGRNSPATKTKRRVLILDVSSDDEEETAPFNDHGGSEKKNECSSSKRNLVYDRNVFVEKEEEKTPQTAFGDNAGRKKKNACSSSKKKVVRYPKDVVEEHKEDAHETPFDSGGCGERKSECSSLKENNGAVNLPKRRGFCLAAMPKLSLQLTREEIAVDFMKITGRRLPRKPNKMPNPKLKGLFPGSKLTEITPDLYNVPEPPVPDDVECSE